MQFIVIYVGGQDDRLSTWSVIKCRQVNKTLDNIDVIACNSLCVQHVIDLRHKDQLITILVLGRQENNIL